MKQKKFSKAIFISEGIRGSASILLPKKGGR